MRQLAQRFQQADIGAVQEPGGKQVQQPADLVSSPVEQLRFLATAVATGIGALQRMLQLARQLRQLDITHRARIAGQRMRQRHGRVADGAVLLQRPLGQLDAQAPRQLIGFVEVDVEQRDADAQRSDLAVGVGIAGRLVVRGRQHRWGLGLAGLDFTRRCRTGKRCRGTGNIGNLGRAGNLGQRRCGRGGVVCGQQVTRRIGRSGGVVHTAVEQQIQRLQRRIRRGDLHWRHGHRLVPVQHQVKRPCLPAHRLGGFDEEIDVNVEFGRLGHGNQRGSGPALGFGLGCGVGLGTVSGRDQGQGCGRIRLFVQRGQIDFRQRRFGRRLDRRACRRRRQRLGHGSRLGLRQRQEVKVAGQRQIGNPCAQTPLRRCRRRCRRHGRWQPLAGDQA